MIVFDIFHQWFWSPVLVLAYYISQQSMVTLILHFWISFCIEGHETFLLSLGDTIVSVRDFNTVLFDCELCKPFVYTCCIWLCECSSELLRSSAWCVDSFSSASLKWYVWLEFVFFVFGVSLFMISTIDQIFGFIFGETTTEFLCTSLPFECSFTTCEDDICRLSQLWLVEFDDDSEFILSRLPLPFDVTSGWSVSASDISDKSDVTLISISSSSDSIPEQLIDAKLDLSEMKRTQYIYIYIYLKWNEIHLYAGIVLNWCDIVVPVFDSYN